MDLNQIFFQEYKKVDKLLAEMYQEDKGVSNYIDELERTFYQRHPTAQTLKKLRHIRNQLAHDPYIDAAICTEAQIEWLKDFYQKLQNQQDPLSIYYKSMQKHKEEPQNESSSADNLSQDYTLIVGILLFLGILTAAVVWVLSTRA